MRYRAWIASSGILLAALLAPAVAAAEGETSKFDMSKGGPTWSHGNNSITLTMFTQARFLLEDKEEFDADPPLSAGAGLEDGVTTGFRLPRIRFGIKGTVFQPWVKYTVTYELSETTGDNSAKFKDAFVEFAKAPMATTRFGQYKVPFSLQELCGDQNQLFAERAVTNVFAPGREAGAAIGGRTSGKHFAYAAGAFNGSGESRAQDDEGLMYVARVVWDPFEEYKLVETAQEAPENHILHFGLGYRTGEPGRGYNTQGVIEDWNDQDAWNFEAGWKWRRWYATAEYFAQSTEVQNPTVGPDVDADGFHVQGSFMAIAKKLEFGARYAVVNADTNAPDSEVTEMRGVVNYYWFGDNLKATFDLGTVEFQANAPGRNVNTITSDTGVRLVTGDVTDVVARFQVQFAF